MNLYVYIQPALLSVPKVTLPALYAREYHDISSKRHGDSYEEHLQMSCRHKSTISRKAMPISGEDRVSMRK